MNKAAKLRAVRAILADFENVPAELSPRRTTVAALLLMGMSAEEIAQELGISRSTARVHIAAVYRHFDVAGQPELMALILLPLALELR